MARRRWTGGGLQAAGAPRGAAMSGLDILAGVVALFLLGYLVSVLLRPEDFS